MNAEIEHAAAIESHVRRIVGPTILMGDGSYFDFADPASTTMSIDDYAWGIAGTNRFRCQTRARLWGGRRCFYNVGQHVVLLARQMIADGHDRADCYDGLMHESGEVVIGDPPGPMKPMVPDLKGLEKECDRGVGQRFGVLMRDPGLIKRYDIRMLATEKRDLMPQGSDDSWQWADGYEPFAFEIEPWSGEVAVEQFLTLWQELRP